MIVYVVTSAHAYTIQNFVYAWSSSLHARVALLFYDQLSAMRQFPAATYIFSDLERLTPSEIERAGAVHDRLVREGNTALNHPCRVLGRYELLRRLHDRGESRFRLYRVDERLESIRFPVFLRLDAEHLTLTDLIHTRADLDAHLAQAVAAGHSPDGLLVAEFCNAADASGVFCKYAAFCVGDWIIPDRLVFGLDWMLKEGDTNLLTAERLRDWWTFRMRNPHEAWLRRRFAEAGVRYGRMDFTVIDGRPQIWEINTNPMILFEPEDYDEETRIFADLLGVEMACALDAVDREKGAGDGTQPVELARERARFERRFRDLIRGKTAVTEPTAGSGWSAWKA